MTENKMSIHKCELCDYETNRIYNLKRHIDIKHAQPKVSLVQPKVSPTQPKVSHEETNNIPLYTCENCNKSYKKQWILNRHIKICKGVKDPFLCNYCNSVFTCKSSKSKHLKICKVKNTALIVKSPDTDIQSQ